MCASVWHVVSTHRVFGEHMLPHPGATAANHPPSNEARAEKAAPRQGDVGGLDSCEGWGVVGRTGSKESRKCPGCPGEIWWE